MQYAHIVRYAAVCSTAFVCAAASQDLGMQDMVASLHTQLYKLIASTVQLIAVKILASLGRATAGAGRSTGFVSFDSVCCAVSAVRVHSQTGHQHVRINAGMLAVASVQACSVAGLWLQPAIAALCYSLCLLSAVISMLLHLCDPRWCSVVCFERSRQCFAVWVPAWR